MLVIEITRALFSHLCLIGRNLYSTKLRSRLAGQYITVNHHKLQDIDQPIRFQLLEILILQLQND